MIHEHVQLWLYAVDETSYERLALSRRRLSCWVISYVKQGHVVIEAPDKSQVAKTGDVMVHPPNQLFSENASTPGVHQWLLVDAKDGSGLELMRRYPLPRVLRLENPNAFEERFAVLERTWREDTSTLREVRATNAALDLLIFLFDTQHLARDLPPSAPTDRFERVIHTMRQHLHEPLSRSDLADKAHLHPNHFDRAFREIYGITPMQMLRELRLRQARQLLETSNHTLEAIAETCGFHDAAYLSRIFKAHFGQTPGMYRARVKSTKRSYFNLL